MAEFSREIYSFIEIAQERSIRRAAEKLNISSSALSRQMRLLEADFGAQLIERRVTGVQLTEAGRVLLRQAERWLSESNRLRAEFRQSGHSDARLLRLGAMECFAGNLVPDLFLHARQRGAADRVQVRYGGTDQLLQSLQDGQLDLVIAFNAHNSQSIRVVSETSCRIGMVCNPRWCDFSDSEIALSRVLDWPICLPDDSLSLHTRLYAEILKQRKTPEIRATSNSIEFIRNLVMRGECVSFLSWFDVRDQVLSGQLRFILLAERRLSERVCVCLSGLRPFTKELAGLARETSRIVEALAGVDAPAG